HGFKRLMTTAVSGVVLIVCSFTSTATINFLILSTMAFVRFTHYQEMKQHHQPNSSKYEPI
ncbi:MAG: hypothetical protein AAB690_00880, partial [Patescibacteria group bacterium]